MAVSPGYNTTIKVTGTSTSFVDEPCTLVTGLTYQITNPAKRIFDPENCDSLGAFDVGTDDSAAIESVDTLFGTFTLTDTPVGAILLGGFYLPTLSVANARAGSVAAEADVLDTTDFTSAGQKSSIHGLRRASGDLEGLSPLNADLDPGGDTLTLQALHDNATPKLLEVLVAAGRYFRAWVLFLEAGEDTKTADVVTRKLKYISIERTVNTPVPGRVSYGFGA